MSLAIKRFSKIDSLRGVAALVVMLHHYFAIYDRDYKHSFRVPYFFNYGFYGVELFFIISGFVIYYTIQKSSSAWIFLAKRFIRLYPTYWLCLFLTFVIVSIFPLTPERNTTLVEAIIDLTMLSGLIGVKLVDPSYWTLLIEFFFYVLMAVLLFSKQMKRIYTVMWIWLLLIIIYNEIQRLPGLGALMNLRYGGFFIAGICFYRIKMMGDKNWQGYMLLLICYLCNVFILRALEGSFIAITLVYLLFAFAIFAEAAVLNAKPLVFLGSISYALYLLHQNIGFVIINQLRSFGFTNVLVTIVPCIVCILLAWTITKYFERPVMNFLNIKLTQLVRSH